MWEWLSKTPIAAAFAGLGIGVVAMLYWLGLTVDEEDDPYPGLDDTQQLPHMPFFDSLDDAIAWHNSQKKKAEELKLKQLNQTKLLELLEAAVSDIEYLQNEVRELRGEKDDVVQS